MESGRGNANYNKKNSIHLQQILQVVASSSRVWSVLVRKYLAATAAAARKTKLTTPTFRVNNGPNVSFLCLLSFLTLDTNSPVHFTEGFFINDAYESISALGTVWIPRLRFQLRFVLFFFFFFFFFTRFGVLRLLFNEQ